MTQEEELEEELEAEQAEKTKLQALEDAQRTDDD